DPKPQYERIKADLQQRMNKVLDEANFIMGAEVKEFEEQLKAYTGSPYAIGCANGTDALQIALMALGVGPGDEVIMPAFTYIATGEVALLLGAKSVFVD